MSKRNRLQRQHHPENTPEYQKVPDAVLRAAGVLMGASPAIHIQLDVNAYWLRAITEVVNSRIEIGTIGSAGMLIPEKRHATFFAFARQLGQHAVLSSDRLDPSTGNLKSVDILTHADDSNGHLVYVPQGAANYKRPDGTIAAQAFTTGTKLVPPGDPYVSFVTADRTTTPIERACMAATEITQNRLRVDGVDFGRGRTNTTWQAYEPFQESLANGAGNMLGHIATGHTYAQYDQYVRTVYAKGASLWGNPIPSTHFHKAFVLAAPHILFDQGTYDSLADGVVPTEPPQLTAVLPQR